MTAVISRQPMILGTDRGLYCPPGDFYIDAWRPVPRTIITHGHSDHARKGSNQYLTAVDGVSILRGRIGEESAILGLRYGEALDLNGVRVSLHPAGHVLGSAQVRVEHKDEVWVVTGDYKRQTDRTCRPFEVVRCNTLITECTFGLPIFRWREPAQIALAINDWWRQNTEQGRTSMLLAYSLGKAQRVISLLDASIGPILLHGAVQRIVDTYRESGIDLPPTQYASVENAKANRGKAIVICPPSAVEGTWARKFTPISIAVASGWMTIRGFRRRHNADRGFVLSDHADWPALLSTIEETRAEHVIATHGYTRQFARYLNEKGTRASVYQTRFTDSDESDATPAEDADE